jgi:hypothetical protein
LGAEAWLPARHVLFVCERAGAPGQEHGDMRAMLDVPAALAKAVDTLHSVHDSLGALPVGNRRSLLNVLVRHAERSKSLDLHKLDKLAAAVATVQHPSELGRRVVITALVLLSNLAADERWFQALQLPSYAA